MPILEVSDTLGRWSAAGKVFRPGQYDLAEIDPKLVPEIVRAANRLIYPHVAIYETDESGKVQIEYAEETPVVVEETPVVEEDTENTGELPGEIEGDEKIGPAESGEDLDPVVDPEPDPVVDPEPEETGDYLCDILGCPKQQNGFLSKAELDAHKATIHGIIAE